MGSCIRRKQSHFRRWHQSRVRERNPLFLFPLPSNPASLPICQNYSEATCQGALRNVGPEIQAELGKDDNESDSKQANEEQKKYISFFVIMYTLGAVGGFIEIIWKACKYINISISLVVTAWMSDKPYIILALFPGRATYVIFIYRRNHHRYHLMRGTKLLKAENL